MSDPTDTPPTELQKWVDGLFRVCPKGIRATLFLDMAQEQGFDRNDAARLVRMGLDTGEFGLGADLQLVREWST